MNASGDWIREEKSVYRDLRQLLAKVPSNFNNLEVAWRFKTDNLGPFPEYKLEGTPLMVNGTIYTTGGTRRSVVALKPDTVSASVSLLFRNLKLPKGASLHTLRHTHGSQLLAAGVPLTDVSKRLGHTNPHVTATVYAHALPGRDDLAAKAWESFQENGKLAKPSPRVRKSA